MKPLFLALALLAPPPLLAETFDCTLALTCTTNNACSSDDNPVVLGVTIADDGASALLTFGEQSLEMALVDDSAIGRTFLALRAGSGIGVMTLGDDGSFAASSNELTNGTLIGATSAGSCTPRNG
ncbi:MAG: hypothetical protein KBF78_15770 [Fuscovulum sp.]|nr:hypothetical protein [Fuscovulum sp.]